jgi:hypothetical protein
LNINGSQFHCHGYIAELDAWVVLGFDPRENPQICRPNAKLSRAGRMGGQAHAVSSFLPISH